MIQTQQMIKRLSQHWPNLKITVEKIRTVGDRTTDVPLSQLGGDGVFVTEIERALQERRIDLAVHSLKDLPTVQPQGLVLVVPGPREDVRDVLVTNVVKEPRTSEADGRFLAQIARIGTCSLRRMAQVRAVCPAAQILPLRGNVDTRLRKLAAGEYDGIILASAGLHRLEMQEHLANKLTYLPIEMMMPAPGQGAICLEMRDEAEMQTLLAPLRDREVQAATSAERMFMRRLGAGCYLPVAAYGHVTADGRLDLCGLVISSDGKQQIRVRRNIPWGEETAVEHAEQLGIDLAEDALARGADAIIHEVHASRTQVPNYV